MFSNTVKRAALAAALLILSSLSALAQSGQFEGDIKTKGPDGKLKPVEDATVDIYRTDINSHWEVKADKRGHFIRLGVPLAGTYVIVVSGPGLTFTFSANVKVTVQPVIDFVIEPGDGTRPTYEQLKAAMVAHKTGAAGAAPPALSAADRAKAEEAAKQRALLEKESKDTQAVFETARTHYNQGIEFSSANNLLGAATEFETASNADPTKSKDIAEVAYKACGNLAEMHYALGVELFNQAAALGATDPPAKLKKREEAKAHFQGAVQAATKAISIASGQTTSTITSDLITYYNRVAKNAALLVEHFGAADQVDPTLAIIEKAEALDTANKNKWGVLRADIYRFAYRNDEAATAYKAVLTADPANPDALYGLGLTLVAAIEKEKIQEGANVLGEFVSKAPATDKRVPIVKEALEAVKNAYKIEAEKPATRSRKRP